MSLRKESIKKLKEAVKNRELGCYKGAETCLYYDSRTDSRCAVGVIVPDEVIDKMKNGYGDCERFISDKRGTAVTCQLEGENTYMGMTIDELSILQSYHDNSILTPVVRGEYIKKLEDYVNNL